MANSNNDHRVLSRTGARILTENELAKVTGSRNTRASQSPTGTISNPDTMLDS